MGIYDVGIVYVQASVHGAQEIVGNARISSERGVYLSVCICLFPNVVLCTI